MRRDGGFTLVEIMLVVLIIGALAAMIVPRLSGRSEQARAAVARADIQTNIATALKMYELDNGMFPTTAQGLQALREKSAASPVPRNWQGPYLEKDPVDPWGNPYVYVSPGTHRADYDLYSKGKDANSSDGYITNW
ncbi:MAG: type II secretion system major pseudopilin GspG [Candidatus Omnitrophica bacterium]|nr:type II secretion system major pseudopilin GspG [Candidatus Omnitrophota bacterium]